MSKARVLVVDDEDTIRKLLKSRLDREGFDVVVAANADEAQGAIEKGGQVAVMITDLKMPGRDGFSLMAWARDKYPHVKVVVITGHGEKDAAVQALRAGQGQNKVKEQKWIFSGFNKFGSMGGAITSRGIELLVRSHAGRLGYEELTPRTFRHTAVVHWFTEGLAREEIQRRLGLRTAYAFRIYEPIFQAISGGKPPGAIKSSD